MKRVIFLSCLVFTLTALTGCTGDSSVEDLKKLEALNTEAVVKSVALTVSEKESAVYKQVVDKSLLTLATSDVSDEIKTNIVTYMDKVDSKLRGTLSESDGFDLDDCYTDYLLMEFQKTPYTWARGKMTLRGEDTASGCVIIDVTYETTGQAKKVMPNSSITLGEPDYDKLLSVRFDRYIELLNRKYDRDKGDTFAQDFATFQKIYGNVADILEEQRDLSLTDNISKTKTQLTYSGMLNSDVEQSGASMTVRFVLVPEYAYGINTGYTCKHMYVLDYALDKQPEEQEPYTAEDSVVISDSVYDVLYRYYKCVDESNYSGLYTLTKDFNTLDRHFKDYFDTSYRKHEGFTLTIYSINGTKVECGVTLSRKVRAKGSNMTMPIYQDKLYYTLDLVGDQLQITNEVLLSSKIEGEPAISAKKIATTGFSSSVTLDSADKSNLEELVSKAGVVQLAGDEVSDSFGEVVDLSLSARQLENLKAELLSIKGKRKSVWVTSYLQGTTNYASVQTRELVQAEDGSIREYDVVYDYVYRGGKWKIFDLNVTSNVALRTKELVTKNAMCVVTATEVEKFTPTTGDTSEIGVVSDAEGITYDYDLTVTTPAPIETPVSTEQTEETVEPSETR